MNKQRKEELNKYIEKKIIKKLSECGFENYSLSDIWNVNKWIHDEYEQLYDEFDRFGHSRFPEIYWNAMSGYATDNYWTLAEKCINRSSSKYILPITVNNKTVFNKNLLKIAEEDEALNNKVLTGSHYPLPVAYRLERLINKIDCHIVFTEREIRIFDYLKAIAETYLYETEWYYLICQEENEDLRKFFISLSVLSDCNSETKQTTEYTEEDLLEMKRIVSNGILDYCQNNDVLVRDGEELYISAFDRYYKVENIGDSKDYKNISIKCFRENEFDLESKTVMHCTDILNQMINTRQASISDNPKMRTLSIKPNDSKQD